MRAPEEWGTALAVLFDPVLVGGLIDEVCAQLVTHERTAVGFGIFHDLADALLCPLVRGLMLEPDELRVTDVARTLLRFGPTGSVARVRLRTVPLDVPRAWGSIALGGWSAMALDDAVRAFAPHLRVRRQAYAAAAGFVLADRADQVGHRLRQVDQARRLASEIALAAGPAIELPPYRGFSLGGPSASMPQRTVCCRRHRFAGCIAEGPTFCLGCPREPEPARSRRLRSEISLRRDAEGDLRPTPTILS